MENGENQKEVEMKTPHAILIGLSLIAAAIFSQDTGVRPAHAYGIPASKEDVEKAIGKCLNGATIDGSRLSTNC